MQASPSIGTDAAYRLWWLGALFVCTAAFALSTFWHAADLQQNGSSANDSRIVPYPDFIRSLYNAKASDYVGRAGYDVENAAAFEEMRQYLINYYTAEGGQNVSSSFSDGQNIFDCVPVMQQPSVRLQHITALATPPPNTPPAPSPAGPPPGSTGDGPVTETMQTIPCGSGDIPLMRLTLEGLAQHHTLEEGFQK